MGARPPVFVYGATGYTGRLVCEQLAERGIDFAVGGRSFARTDAWCRELGCGVPIEVAHNRPALAEAFSGAQVLINCTGPSGLLGRDVIGAALDASCHYLDIGGEQDFMLEIQEELSDAFDRAQRVAVPANAWYYAIATALAELCLDSADVDTLSIVYAVNGDPTVASWQSLMRTARRPGFSVRDGKLAPNRSGTVSKVAIPGQDQKRYCLLIPGGEIVFLHKDERVKAAEVLLNTQRLRSGVPMMKVWDLLSRGFGDRLDRISDTLVKRVMKTPLPERASEARYTIGVTGRGRGDDIRCEVFGTRPYALTGYICAVTAQWLLAGQPLRTGVQSTSAAFGIERFLTEVIEVGTQIQVNGKPWRARPGLPAESAHVH